MIPTPQEFKETIMPELKRQREEEEQLRDASFLAMDLQLIEDALRKGRTQLELIVRPKEARLSLLQGEVAKAGWKLTYLRESYGIKHVYTLEPLAG